mmetsp:Transcript_36078/g.55394  ORF Transcript_36078/g.55394 Transcript_36078/m.55394 type:complete len:202 (-) Transcript_36078:1631-2236(-)
MQHFEHEVGEEARSFRFVTLRPSEDPPALWVGLQHVNVHLLDLGGLERKADLEDSFVIHQRLHYVVLSAHRTVALLLQGSRVLKAVVEGLRREDLHFSVGVEDQVLVPSLVQLEVNEVIEPLTETVGASRVGEGGALVIAVDVLVDVVVLENELRPLLVLLLDEQLHGVHEGVVRPHVRVYEVDVSCQELFEFCLEHVVSQ